MNWQARYLGEWFRLMAPQDHFLVIARNLWRYSRLPGSSSSALRLEAMPSWPLRLCPQAHSLPDPSMA